VYYSTVLPVKLLDLIILKALFLITFST